MSSLLESGGGKKNETKLESCQGRSESGEKGGTWKTCILLLVQTNPNEENHCPSWSEIIMENSEHDALCWTANDRAEIAAAYETE